MCSNILTANNTACVKGQVVPVVQPLCIMKWVPDIQIPLNLYSIDTHFNASTTDHI